MRVSFQYRDLVAGFMLVGRSKGTTLFALWSFAVFWKFADAVVAISCWPQIHFFCGVNLPPGFCAGTEMAQLVCGGCHTLLMYIRGATSVQCSCCHTVNLAMEGSTPMKLLYISPLPQLKQVYSVALIPVCKIHLLKRIYSVVGNSSNQPIAF